MKTKSIFFSLLLLLGVGVATTSCEDMFTTDNELVETNLAPQDTVYNMMGIVRNMQKVVEKSILLGEVRADLVDVNAFTTTALQELSNNNVSLGNEYNNPADFYAVINSCNIYLNYVDSLQETMGVKKFKKEIIATKCYRAWTYLELAKIYGTVPFYTDPLITAQEGEDVIADTSNRTDLVGICDWLIKDLEPYAYLDENNDLKPSYSASFHSLSYRYFFLPVRLMLAELYLYRGSFTHNQSDFVNAVRFYHDYLAFKNEEINTTSARSFWVGTTLTGRDVSYNNNFWLSNDNRNQDYVVFIPIDTIAYYGNTTDVVRVFNSQYANNYYAYVNPSKSYLELSQAQLNTVYVYNSAADVDTFYVAQDETQFNEFDNPERYVGDLRYATVLSTFDQHDMYHAEYSTNRQFISKYVNDQNGTRLNNDQRTWFLPLYRKSTVYLHMAEALNRAGLPETAFAVLKYGISDTVLGDSTKVSRAEYDILKSITSYGYASDAADWDDEVFITRDRMSGGNNASGSNTGGTSIQVNQWGIHCLGSGDAWCNKYYCIPTDSTGMQEYPVYNPVDEEGNPLADEALAAYDEAYQAARQAVSDANSAYLRSPDILEARMKAVDKLILDEEALENAYEGTRFYDLMRYSMYTYGNYSAVVDAVAKRKGADAVNSVGTLSPSNVYIPLRTR